MLKKYWLVFGAVYLFFVHIIGGVIFIDYAYAAGNLLIAAIIGGIITYRAKSLSGVRAGHLTQVVIGIFLVFTAYSDATERTHEDIFNGCRYNNQNTSAAMISEESKDNYCNCVADLMVDDIMAQGTLAALLFQELEPIENNLSLQKDANAAAMTCSQLL